MSLQDGYVEEDENYNYTPIFSIIQGNLSIGAPVVNELLTTFGDEELITPLQNPNENNNFIIPAVEVGGTLM